MVWETGRPEGERIEVRSCEGVGVLGFRGNVSAPSSRKYFNKPVRPLEASKLLVPEVFGKYSLLFLLKHTPKCGPKSL